MGASSGAVRVRVPATSANMGPGFDAVGLALGLHDEVEARAAESGLWLEISGEGEGDGLAAAGEDHLVVRAMRAAFAVTGGQPPGLRLRCVNRIPHGRGLGSSAAAIVAGLLAARELSPDRDKLPDDALFRLACDLEGHPDNVAACLGGGLTVAWTSDPGPGEPRMVRLEPRPSIRPVLCIAPAPVRTEVARGLLPDMVPHRDAAAGAGRSALLVAALTQDGLDEGVLFDATEDRLHQDYRAEAMPETGALLRRLRRERIPAVVSGAGPSVLVLLTSGPDYGRDLDTLGSIVRETGIAWHVSSLEVERQGARVLRPWN